METLVLFLCVCAATVLTNGVILFLVAKYVMSSMRAISREESERLSQLQEQGTQALSRLTGALAQGRKAGYSPFGGFGQGGGDEGPKGQGSA